jgi:hypothetical protein
MDECLMKLAAGSETFGMEADLRRRRRALVDVVVQCGVVGLKSR